LLIELLVFVLICDEEKKTNMFTFDRDDNEQSECGSIEIVSRCLRSTDVTRKWDDVEIEIHDEILFSLRKILLNKGLCLAAASHSERLPAN
jgi:hypothetical protein